LAFVVERGNFGLKVACCQIQREAGLTLWAKAKETVTKSTGALTLEGLKIALSTLVKHALGS